MKEAGVTFAAVGVEDPQVCPPARRAEAVPGDHHLGPLPDDVAAEPDPGPAGELETETRRFPDRARDRCLEPGRLEDDEERPRPAGESAQPVEAVGHGGRADGPIGAERQVDEEEVDRSALEERAGHREALVEGRGGEHDEPLGTDAPSDGLDRIERPGDVEPGYDRTVGLGLGRKPERKGRLARRVVAPEGEAGAPRHAAGKDRIERREAGPDDVLARRSGCWGEVGRRYGDKRADDLADHLVTPPWSCRTPARLEGGESGRDVRGAGHRGPC